MEMEAELPSRRLDLFPTERRGVFPGSQAWLHGKAWDYFLEQLQPLSSHPGCFGQTCDVAARPSKTSNQAQLDRIWRRTPFDRDCLVDLLDSTGRVPHVRQQRLNLKTEELGCEVRKAVAIALGVSVFDGVFLPQPILGRGDLLEMPDARGAIRRRAWC